MKLELFYCRRQGGECTLSNQLMKTTAEDSYEQNRAGQAQVGALDRPVVSSSGEIRISKKQTNEAPTLRPGED